MKKKIIAVLVLALVVSTASVFALGIGVQGGYTVNGSSSGALTIKPDGSDLIFAVNGNTYWNGLWIEGTADKWFANKRLASPVNYFYGMGAAAGVDLWSNNLSVTAGVRLVAGINSYFLDDFLEVYLQGAWQPGVRLNLGNTGLPFLQPLIWQFPINLGLRIWL